jgi:KDO2-lipid IV(A) lauroyltransferase
VSAVTARARPPFGRGRTAARLLGRVIDVAAWIASRLPARLAHALAVVGGTLEWALRPGLRRRLATNLGHAVSAPPTSPAVRRIVRRELVNEAKRSADLLWSIGKPDEFLRTVDFRGAEHGLRALADGRGVILAGIHLGGWELAVPLALDRLGARGTVVTADDWLAWAMEHIRTRAGLDSLPRTGPALGAVRVLTGNGIFLVLADDAWGDAPRRYPIPFCDAVAELPAGVATLARLSQSPIVVFEAVPVGPRRWRMTLQPAIEPPPKRGGEEAERTVLAEVAQRFTAMIGEHPEHWAARFEVAWQEAA